MQILQNMFFSKQHMDRFLKQMKPRAPLPEELAPPGDPAEAVVRDGDVRAHQDGRHDQGHEAHVQVPSRLAAEALQQAVVFPNEGKRSTT